MKFFRRKWGFWKGCVGTRVGNSSGYGGRPQRSWVLGWLMLCATLVSSLSGQETGWQQSSAGTYSYFDLANWAGGDVNGVWGQSLTLGGSQVVTFSEDTPLSTGLNFQYAGSANLTFRSNGSGPQTLELGGDVWMRSEKNQTVTFGSSSSLNQHLHIDLGGEERILTVFGSGNGGNFGRTLDFRNEVSNGAVVVSGGGSGGGLARFSSAANSLSALGLAGGEVSFNGAASTAVDTVNTIEGALVSRVSANAVTLSASLSRNTLVQAGSFTRQAGSTILFRGAGLGANPIGTGTNSTNVQFLAAPLLFGASGGAGSTTQSILAGAFGDISATGSGFGTTGGLVTYDELSGIRVLDASEYTSAIADGQTQLDNVRYVNSSGTISATHLTRPLTIINSLSFSVTGSSGNQGVRISGDPGTALRISSGVIHAYQNVTTGGSPSATDAMVIDVPMLDLNGREGIVLASTKFNTGGGNTSNAGLMINSTISNGIGLTIGDGQGGAQGYVVLGGSGSNSYTGNTTVNGAAVRLGKSISDSIGNIVLNLGAIYDAGNQITDTADVTIHGGTFYLNGSANSGSATSETIGSLTMTGGSVSSGQGSGNTFTVNGNVALSGGTVAMPTAAKLIVGGTTTLSGGVISLGRSNNASYNSRATLSGPLWIVNTTSGSYTPISLAAGNSGSVQGGQLELLGDVTFSGNSDNANTVVIAAPAGPGPQGVVVLNGERRFSVGDGAAAVDLSIQAPLMDGAVAGGLIKEGAGTLEVRGENIFTGATAINAGTLLINGTSRSAVSVSGGVLGGSGSVVNTVTVGGGGTLAPGEGVGIIKTGGLFLSGAGATLAMEIEGPLLEQYDRVNVTGDVSLGGYGNLALTLLSFVPQSAEIYFLILNDGFDAISGTLAGVAQGETFVSGGYLWQVSYEADAAGGLFTGGNDLAVQMVPEPAAGILVLLGLSTLAGRRRCRVSAK